MTCLKSVSCTHCMQMHASPSVVRTNALVYIVPVQCFGPERIGGGGGEGGRRTSGCVYNLNFIVLLLHIRQLCASFMCVCSCVHVCVYVCVCMRIFVPLASHHGPEKRLRNAKKLALRWEAKYQVEYSD